MSIDCGYCNNGISGHEEQCPTMEQKNRPDRLHTGEAMTNSLDLLTDLVQALDGAFISSWQSTAAWQQQLDRARDFIEAAQTAPILAK